MLPEFVRILKEQKKVQDGLDNRDIDARTYMDLMLLLAQSECFMWERELIHWVAANG